MPDLFSWQIKCSSLITELEHQAWKNTIVLCLFLVCGLISGGEARPVSCVPSEEFSYFIEGFAPIRHWQGFFFRQELFGEFIFISQLLIFFILGHITFHQNQQVLK